MYVDMGLLLRKSARQPLEQISMYVDMGLLSVQVGVPPGVGASWAYFEVLGGGSEAA